jgi:ribonuclease HI
MGKKKVSVQQLVTRRYETEGVVVAWTDGACEPNPGAGGWGVLVEKDGAKLAEHMGGERSTTNNRMEMTAVLKALENTTGDIIIRTDSQLVLLCAVGRWKRKSNLDLWSEYARLSDGRNVMFEWWRGHIGTPGNEAADRLAEIGRLKVVG